MPASETPSRLYRQQIKNLSDRMQDLAEHAASYPSGSRDAFNKTAKDFAEVQDEAYLCCSSMDHARSIENEERATHAATDLMAELVHLKNDARALVLIKIMEHPKKNA